MKKFFMIMMMAMTVLATSCKENYDVVYNVAAEGDADGEVNVSFVNGTLNAKGDADMQFAWSNDTTTVADFVELSYEDAINSDNKDIRKAADYLTANYTTAFGAEAVSGTFAFRFHGYVYETKTKVKIPFDFEVTNREITVVETEPEK